MGKTRYSKAKLEEMLYVQMQHIDAMHDLLRIVRAQTELINNVGEKLQDEMRKLEPNPPKPYRTPRRKKNSKALGPIETGC